MYRRAGRTRRTEVLLPLEVLQQVEYAAGFKDQTEGFTKWPALEPRPITGG